MVSKVTTPAFNRFVIDTLLHVTFDYGAVALHTEKVFNFLIFNYWNISSLSTFKDNAFVENFPSKLDFVRLLKHGKVA